MPKSWANAHTLKNNNPVEALPKEINRRIGQAMATYEMLADGDRVLIAVSGGIDSLVLVRILKTWLAKAPIDFHLHAVHLDMGFDPGTAGPVADRLEQLAVPYRIEQTYFGQIAQDAEDGKSACYHCSRQRRNFLFSLAGTLSCNKIAFGHHREDIIETFFMNLLYSGNLSTMVPRQDLFDGTLSVIRPLAYLDKQEIVDLGRALHLQPVANPCPLSEKSKRSEDRTLLGELYSRNERIKGNIFAALSNVRKEYLLTKDATRLAKS